MAHYVCQERYGLVISKHGNQTERVARFLKPCATSADEAERVSARAHLLFEEMSSRQKGWPNRVNLQGWPRPQKNWDEWVEKLKLQHSFMWKKIGIYDAIMDSCCDIRWNKEIILGLVEFWCSETNTFVFPWGEATITLEDVMILGGSSVLGEPIKNHVTTEELMMVVDAMIKRKSAILKGKSKKTTYGAWMKHFMENENDNEVEHASFLSYWLSRYVFPSTKETVSADVFPVAAHLAGGTQMALAPAVLAYLYKNVSLLKEKALSSFNDDELTVIAPFRLVLLWAFEHFPHLLQTSPNVLKPGEPRAARWHNVICKMDKSAVNTIFLSGKCFLWRPYSADITNWNHSSYYRADEHLEIDTRKNSDQNLQCYVICMTMCYLVGLDCRMRYMPHRVAMQFGIDQDLPGDFSELIFSPKDVCFFVPPRSFEPGVSLKYFNWWKNSEFICGGKLPNVLRRSLETFQKPLGVGEISSKDYHTPSVTTRLKDSETVSRSFIKDEVIEIPDEEWEFKKRNSFDVLVKPVSESAFPTREAGSLERKSLPSIEELETVSRSSIKDEVIEIPDEEWEFEKWNNFDVLVKPVSESDFPTREAGSLKRNSSPSIEEVKGGGGSNASAESFESGSPECSTPCSVRVRSLASITRELSPTQRFQDSVVTDRFAVMGTPKEMAKDSKEIDDDTPSSESRKDTSDEVLHLNKTIRKRKLSTFTEESSDCKETFSIMNDNTDEMQVDCFNATMDVDERNLDLQILELEKRIEKLEKKKGITPDRG